MEFNLSGFTTKRPKGEPKGVRLLILGAGPAGMTAALYGARAELAPVVITGTNPGGQAALTHTIENYPGFPEGIGGSSLGDLFQKQAERFGAVFEFATATGVDLSSRPFKVNTDGQDYLSDTLIIATGASPNHLQVPGESELTGRGVSYCGTCDGWFFKGKKVVVVGGGDSALEESLFLTRYATSVDIIHRRDALRAGVLLQKRAQDNPKINIIWNTVVTAVNGKDAVQSVQLRNVQTGELKDYPTDGLFVFVGHTPNTQLFTGILDLDVRGYIVVDMQMRTGVPGVFACGEAADPHYRQVVTSAGMGAAAAIQATRFLEAES